MKKIILLTLSLLLSAAPLIGDTIYDSSKQEFIQKQGGIAEYALNQSEHSDEEIEYLKTVDEEERKLQLASDCSQLYERELSYDIIEIIKQYQQLIYTAKRKPKTAMNNQERELRNLLDILNKHASLPELPRVKTMYEIITDYIYEQQSKHNTKPFDMSENSFNIVPIYFTLFTYYNLNVTFRVGTFKNGEEKTVHAWMWMRINENKPNEMEFDLDPSRYHKAFAPIEVRISNFDKMLWDNTI